MHRYHAQPCEIPILSKCETTEGDNKAAESKVSTVSESELAVMTQIPDPAATLAVLVAQAVVGPKHTTCVQPWSLNALTVYVQLSFRVVCISTTHLTKK